MRPREVQCFTCGYIWEQYFDKCPKCTDRKAPNGLSDHGVGLEQGGNKGVSSEMRQVELSGVLPKEGKAGVWPDNKEPSHWFSAPYDSSVPHRGNEECERGDSAKWTCFESFFHISKTAVPWFTISVGDGDREKIIHGALPRIDKHFPSEVSSKPIVGYRWRWVHCRLDVDTVQREVCIKISGQVLGPAARDFGSITWEKAVLIKSVFAVADWLRSLVAGVDL